MRFISFLVFWGMTLRLVLFCSAGEGFIGANSAAWIALKRPDKVSERLSGTQAARKGRADFAFRFSQYA